MLSSHLTKIIRTYSDFPKEGIISRDILPVLAHPQVYSELIENMASSPICKEAEAILSIDARGFLFGSGIALKLSKPMIVARKLGKLPGDFLSASYELEYGSNSLSIQKDALNAYQSYSILDDLLATGGTVECVSKILQIAGKDIFGLAVAIELTELNGRSRFDIPIDSQVSY